MAIKKKNGKASAVPAAIPQTQFDFNLYDPLTGQNYSATTNAPPDGTFSFPTLTYTEPGTYTYYITEKPSSAPNWSYDGSTYRAVVNVYYDGDGNLVASVNYPDGLPNFVNTYNTPVVNVDIGYNKSVAFDPNAGTPLIPLFKFILTDNATGLVVAQNDSPDGSYTFSSLTFTEPGVYSYTVSELPGAPGWSHDSRTFRVNVVVTQDATGNLSYYFDYPDGYPAFINTYLYPPVNVQIQSIKHTYGAPLVSGQFTFGLYDGFGNLLTTTTNEASGSIMFNYAFPTPSNNVFYIREITPSGGGWTTDPSSYAAAVNVSNTGAVSVTYYPNGAIPSFNNYYRATPVEVSFPGLKGTNGWNGGHVPFDFNVTETSTGNIVATGQSDASGNINFTPIQFTEPGEYRYTITESTPSGNGWTTDPSVFRINVFVSSDSLGNLVPALEIPDGFPGFTNTYSATPASVAVSGTKSASGGTLVDGQFEFGIYNDDGDLIATTSNDAAGNIVFSNIIFPSAGGYHYTMKELTPSGNGWTTDGSSYPVDITVTDNGTGALIPNVTYPSGTPNFTNIYDAEPTEANIFAYKALSGWNGVEKQFNFTLKDQYGNIVSTAVNNEGIVSFSPISYDAPGTYLYYITETTPSGGGWTIDSTTYPVEVTVTDNGMGQHITGVTYPDGTPSFINSYSAAAASATLTSTKSAVGATLPDGQFEFGVFDSNGNLIATTSNDAAGNVVFPPIVYENAGNNDYTIRELSSSGSGWTVDPSSYPANVVVTDNRQGRLEAAVSYPSGTPHFTNYYAATPTTASATAFKSIDGWSGTEVPFNFALRDGSGTVVSTATNSNGVVTFPASTFTAPGVYNYTMVETSPSGGGFTTDSAVLPVTVTVTTDGNGILVAAVSYPNGQTFTNTYSAAPATVAFTGKKSTVGAPIEAGAFQFGVFDGNGNLVGTATNDGSGNIVFSDITYNASGDYSYTVRELDESGSGWTIDGSVYPVNVAVADNNGNLVAAVSYPNGVPNFTNIYSSTPSEVVIRGYKSATGAPLVPGQFTFGLYNASGNLISTTANDNNGEIIFPGITYSQIGTNDYTVREITQSGGGWTTDSAVYPATVTVVDIGGELTAEVTYPDGNPIFINVYNSTPSSATIIAHKSVSGEGAVLTPGLFEFGLFDANGNLIYTATNDSNGCVGFPSIDYTQIGTNNYTVRELTPSGGEWTTDPTMFPAVVMVTDIDGQLTAVVSYPAGEPAFVNVKNATPPPPPYEPIPIYPSAHKSVRGTCGECVALPPCLFSFGLYDAGGNLVQTATNDACGNISFTPINLSAPGIYDYTVRELTASSYNPCYGGWYCDTRSFTVRVIITDQNGILHAEAEYPDGYPEFVNYYAR